MQRRRTCIVAGLAAVLLACGASPGTEPDANPVDAAGNPVDAAGNPVDAAGNPVDAAPPSDATPLTDGVVTLVGQGFAGMMDGPRNVATFDNPVNTVLAPNGDLIVADFNNNSLRRVTPEGLVSTVVASGTLQLPFGLAFTPDGSLYVQTDDNALGQHSIETGTIWRVNTVTGNVVAIASDIGRPRGLAALPDGHLVLSDRAHHDVRLLNPSTGVITPLAGVRGMPGFVDGTAIGAKFNDPRDVVVTSTGDILVVDMGNARIRRVTLAGVVTTAAGNGDVATVDGAAATASFDGPISLAIDASNVVYVCDSGSGKIRKLASSTVTTIAGSTLGFADGVLLDAKFFGVEGVDISADGAFLYVADGTGGFGGPYHRIRRVTLP